MLLSKPEIVRMFHAVSRLWLEQKNYLSEIDSRFGDGDHGVTIGKIAAQMEQNLENWTDDSTADFLEELGDDIMAIGGGSAGPLYGTMIGGMSGALSQNETIDAEKLKKMFEASLEAMEEITTAKLGDKTMMDALIPAVEAAQKTEGDIPEILEAAAKAAAKGAEQSKEFISKFGRAKSYKEQTIGTPDAGAMSTSIFFQGLYQGFITQ